MRVLVGVLIAVAACGGGDGTIARECDDGETRGCYTGPDGTAGVGPCQTGLEVCSAGQWPGICIGDVVPLVEQCNDYDDNCNGVADDVDGTGETCTGTNGCEGVRMCDDNGRVRCFAPSKNECDLCGGPDVSEVGNNCTANGCLGDYVCSIDQRSAVCNAPTPNECGLCGGSAVTGLNVDCMSTDGCTGVTVCNSEGDMAVCGAPMKNQCMVCGGPAVTDLGMTCTGTGGCAGQRACNQAGTASVCDCSANLCNDNGTLRPIVMPVAGDLVITEVMPNPLGTDSDQEWFEIKVNANVDLNSVALGRVGTTTPNRLTSFDCVPVTAGSLLVFARDTDPAVNGGIATALITDTFTFSLVAPGDLQVLVGTTPIDTITWTTAANGASLQVDPDFATAALNDNEANFCNGTSSYGAGGAGTPGVANAECIFPPPPGQCDQGGNNFRAIVPPTSPNLVISEVMPNPTTEPAQEWFEITNIGTASFDLNGLGIDRDTDSAAPDVISSNMCIPIAGGARAVIARSAAATVGVPTVDAQFTFTMVNTSGEVRIVDPASCTGTPAVCTTIYDSASWSTTTDGVSLQLPPTSVTTTSNDSTSSAYCTTTNTYDGTQRGTPRAVNVCN